MFLAQLGSQSANVNIDGSSTAVVVVTPHPRQQQFASEHFAGVLHEELEQLVLHVGEIERHDLP